MCSSSAVPANVSLTWTSNIYLQVTIATFTSYVLSGHPLTSDAAFVSLSLFNILRFPMNIFPMMITYIITVSVLYWKCMRRDRFILCKRLWLEWLHLHGFGTHCTLQQQWHIRCSLLYLECFLFATLFHNAFHCILHVQLKLLCLHRLKLHELHKAAPLAHCCSSCTF